MIAIETPRKKDHKSMIHSGKDKASEYIFLAGHLYSQNAMITAKVMQWKQGTDPISPRPELVVL